eukprot:scaffold202296_cov17-Prasinocladus_malaysianus.AAC.1
MVIPNSLSKWELHGDCRSAAGTDNSFLNGKPHGCVLKARMGDGRHALHFATISSQGAKFCLCLPIVWLYLKDELE